MNHTLSHTATGMTHSGATYVINSAGGGHKMAVGTSGNDRFHATTSGKTSDQIHIMAGDGDDTLNLNMAVLGLGTIQHGHHVFGGKGADRFAFTNVHMLRGTVVGRIDDLTSEDSIFIGTQRLDLSRPQAIDGCSVQVVLYQGQQWLEIRNTFGGRALYNLEGARQERQADGSWADEAHFLSWNHPLPAALPVVAYEDPINFIPAWMKAPFRADHDLSATGEVTAPVFQNGTAHNDMIVTKRGHDVILAGDGNDSIDGFMGADTIFGGAGNDLIEAGKGRDHLFGDAGHDVIAGGSDADRLAGGSGNDTLFGGSEGDALLGGGGADLLRGGTGGDELRGGHGNDRLFGDGGNDILIGDDVPQGSAGGGDDILHGGAGRDSIWGGTGADNVWGGIDDDVVFGGTGGDHLRGDHGNDRLHGGAGPDRINGGAGNDSLIGDDLPRGNVNGGNDILDGGAGNDSIWGGTGADILTGGPGTDVLFGGAGADVFIFSANESRSDVIMDFARGDRIDLSSMDLTLAARFSGRSGQLIVQDTESGARLQADLNGDRVADFGLIINSAVDYSADTYVDSLIL